MAVRCLISRWSWYSSGVADATPLATSLLNGLPAIHLGPKFTSKKRVPSLGSVVSVQVNTYLDDSREWGSIRTNKKRVYRRRLLQTVAAGAETPRKLGDK